MSDDLYYVSGDTMTDIADAIRDMRQESGTLTPSQMVSKIEDTRIGVPLNVVCHYSTTGWVRPNNYPDITVLYDTIADSESRVYFTYDLTKTPGYGWVGIYCAGDSWMIERGHIENGAFVSDWSSSQLSSGTFFRQDLDSSNGDVQLWCIHNVIANKKITRFCFVPNSTTDANNYINSLQPCVERCGKLPYAVNFTSSHGTTSNSGSIGTRWLKKDTLDIGRYTKVTTLDQMYSGCLELEEVSCNSWNTSGWEITSMNGVFSNCRKLRNLDLSGWDTSSWKITGTGFANAWNYCNSLQTLNISTWDVSGWTPTSLASTWCCCFSLKELDLSSWDTTNWNIGPFATTWDNCQSLRKLDISTWNTTNWQVTTLNNTWYNCCSLEKLDIANWNTTNWVVATLAYTWGGCSSLRELNLSSWITTNWELTTLDHAWYYCWSLKTLNISSWNTSNWVVTSLTSMFEVCRCIETLDLNNWVTTNWCVDTFNSTWYGCYSLRDLKINQWDTSNWAVTTLSSTFAYCYSLETINLNSWDTSNWVVTSVYYLFNNSMGASTIDISGWDISNFNITDARTMYQNTSAETLLLQPGLHGTTANSKYTANVYGLVNFVPPALDIDQNYSYSPRLSKQSLVGIINNLPTVTSKTLTIGQTNELKLTVEEIAVATQKGWTVA